MLCILVHVFTWYHSGGCHCPQYTQLCKTEAGEQIYIQHGPFSKQQKFFKYLLLVELKCACAAC